MAGSGFSTAVRNEILTARFKTAASVYGCCCDGDPTDTGDLANQEIAAASAYARTACVFGDNAATGTISNTAALEFPAASGGNWGTIGWLAIASADVEAVDDMIASGPLSASKVIDDGDQLVFAIGNIDVAIAVQA